MNLKSFINVVHAYLKNKCIKYLWALRYILYVPLQFINL